MAVKWRHTIKKLGDLSCKTTEKMEGSIKEDAYRLLAWCFKQLNKKTRDDNTHIIKAEQWNALDGEGDLIFRFKFLARYDSDNEYLHIYEFIKCPLF